MVLGPKDIVRIIQEEDEIRYNNLENYLDNQLKDRYEYGVDLNVSVDASIMPRRIRMTSTLLVKYKAAGFGEVIYDKDAGKIYFKHISEDNWHA